MATILRKENREFKADTNKIDNFRLFSDKILLAPSFEIFRKDSVSEYFEGEDKVSEKWIVQD